MCMQTVRTPCMHAYGADPALLEQNLLSRQNGYIGWLLHAWQAADFINLYTSMWMLLLTAAALQGPMGPSGPGPAMVSLNNKHRLSSGPQPRA